MDTRQFYFTNDKETVERFRSELRIIRRIAGWSMDDLARLLNVTRQTVYLMEHTPGRMSRVNYLAIRMLLLQEYEMYHKDILPMVVSVLIDRHDVTEQERQMIRDTVVTNCERLGTKAGSEAIAKSISQELKEVLDTMGMKGEYYAR